MIELTAPLTFIPTYQNVIWGGRRMEQWRSDLPAGTIGESWDIADHERGMSIVAAGPLAGASLHSLCREHGRELVGAGHDGGDFPLLVKLIDAREQLSVQVHPDDALAQSLGAGQRGKTECWLMVHDGGELFVGTRPGVTRSSFERSLDLGQVSEVLNRYQVKNGDFFFLEARTVHALGSGCLLYEVQQTCDITFRVHDWGRLGPDGKPRATHRSQSLDTISWGQLTHGPVQSPSREHPAGGMVRRLADCPYFSVEERRAQHTQGGGNGSCSIVVAISGHGRISTAGGETRLKPMHSVLIPAAAGAWSASAEAGQELRLLVSQPHG
jgi:mannose-6-phosphate isomerase